MVVCVHVRRLNMTDIERIAPLEEGSLPYHLAETQKQVRCFLLLHNRLCVLRTVTSPCDFYLQFYLLLDSWGHFQACVAPSCRVGLQVHPGLHRRR